MTPPTLADALRSAIARLAMHESARPDAELLLAQVLGQSRSYLRARPERVLTETEMRDFEALVARRAAGEPIAHILGRREFWSLDLEVTPDTLIPRPETELLVELALERIPMDAAWDVLDLGVGSGAIALALAAERPRCRIHASDLSAEAIAVAELNARTLGLTNVQFGRGDWYAPFSGRRFHIIVSNPPYIGVDDPHLNAGDVRFEPRLALVSESNGLRDLRTIVNGAPAYLWPEGWLLVEHGYDQGAQVAEMLANVGFQAVSTARDLGGQARVGLGRLPPTA